MRREDLRAVLRDHAKWLRTGGRIGCRAYMSGADLRGVDWAGVNLRGADLSRSKLSLSDISGADLDGADIRGAVLCSADLCGTNLRGARVNSATRWPSPTMVLMASWGELSDDLTVECMRYDAANHPRPEAFDEWSRGGPCPYADCQWQRCVNFVERRELWSPGPALSALELAQRLIRECCHMEDE